MEAAASNTPDDVADLQKLGYQQTLVRILTLVDNFLSSFSTMGFVSGVGALYGFGMLAGGPQVMIVNWIIVGLLACITSLVMAEICSAYPTSGGIYYWSGRLGGPRYGPFLSFLTAWWSFAGWIASVTSVAQVTTLFVISWAELENPEVDLVTKAKLPYQFLIATAFIVCGFLFVGLSERVIQAMLRISGVCFALMFVFYIIWLPAAAPGVNHAAGSTLINGLGWTGDFGYVWACGLLYPAFVWYGYDASAHVAEETIEAKNTAARGMWTAPCFSYLFSIPLILILLYLTPDFVAVTESRFAQPITTMWYQSMGIHGCRAMLFLHIVCGVFTSSVNLLSATRVTYAISRDDVIPGSHIWRRMSSSGQPIYACALATTLAILLEATVMGSVAAFYALGSIGTIAVTTSYAFPIFGRLFISRENFVKNERGPFHLGAFTFPLGCLALGFIALEFIILLMPTYFPILYSGPEANFNYACIMIGGITIISTSSWVFYARHWFKGPAHAFFAAQQNPATTTPNDAVEMQ